MPSESADRVAAEERLFSLVLALLASERGLTKPEILSSVQGYRQRYQPGQENGALDRQFERDKDDLRELGVPLQTLGDPGDPGNNHELRYRIPKGAYELPSDIRFTQKELALLGLAATVWREGSLSGESRRAVMKLTSLGIEPDDTVLGFAPRVRVRDAAFQPLSTALDKRRVVTFPYLKPGDSRARVRRFEPLALVQHQGRWHVYGVDQDAQAPRTFLLSRIVGPVELGSATFHVEGGDYAERALDELDALWESNTAQLEVVPGTDAAARLGNRYKPSTEAARSEDERILTVHFTDLHILADELAGYGPEVMVLSPETLREAVRDRLLAVAAAHREGAS